MPPIAELDETAAATTPGTAATTAGASSPGPTRSAAAAATATVESTTGPRQHDDGLWHICRKHRRVIDGPCELGCVTLCGKPLDPDGQRPESELDGMICVVCGDLCR